MALDKKKLNACLAKVDSWSESEHNRDKDGKFASNPGGSTTYEHFSNRPESASENRKFKAVRAKAHEHAEFLRQLGHEGVKVTKQWGNFTAPGRGSGVNARYTTHHGQPKNG